MKKKMHMERRASRLMAFVKTSGDLRVPPMILVYAVVTETNHCDPGSNPRPTTWLMPTQVLFQPKHTALPLLCTHLWKIACHQNCQNLTDCHQAFLLGAKTKGRRNSGSHVIKFRTKVPKTEFDVGAVIRFALFRMRYEILKCYGADMKMIQPWPHSSCEGRGLVYHVTLIHSPQRMSSQPSVAVATLHLIRLFTIHVVLYSVVLPLRVRFPLQERECAPTPLWLRGENSVFGEIGGPIRDEIEGRIQ